jgi:hypothetical protein
MNPIPVSHRSTWWKNLSQAWPDLRQALLQPEFRSIASIAGVTFVILTIVDVVAGMLKYKGYLAAEAVQFYRISEQGSLGEFAGYFATQMSVIFVVVIAFRMQSSLHMMIAVLLEYLMLDDMFMVHETIGSGIAKRFLTGDYLFPAQALGELCFGVLFCLTIMVVFVLATRASTPYLRSLCALLFAPLCLLAFCAIGVDFFHSLVPRNAKYLDGVVALIEDGGELFAMLVLLLVATAQWLALPWLAPSYGRALNSP